MENLYEKYQNIQLFATKYRNLTLIDEKFLAYNEFKNNMQLNEYVSHEFHNPKNNKPLHIYFLINGSRHIKDTKNFKKLLDRFRNETHLIMITKEELSIYCKKALRNYRDIYIKNYLHRHFVIEMNRGPLCSQHTILTPEEIKRVCYSTMSHAHKFPAISMNDPQIIWIGAEINDVIRIDSYSQITGKVITYRIVTPKHGKIIQSNIIAKKNIHAKSTPTTVKNLEDIVEEDELDAIPFDELEINDDTYEDIDDLDDLDDEL
jgi:DNA-directed RNA polymerase subunit H (RpoH/RPB5)